jgi:hypothetical protein
MSRMIVLTGAPEQSKLDWSEKSLSPPAHLENVSQTPQPVSKPSWRQLNTEKLQMRPILPKLDIGRRPPNASDTQSTEFFVPSDFVAQESPGSDVSGDESNPSGTSLESSPEALADFYDHSFTIHSAIPSSDQSQLSDAPPQTPIYESSQDMAPMPTTPGGGIIRTPSQRRLSQAPRPNTLTDLRFVPNASYLSSIAPQTMTVNLIVGIISISPPRRVTTGKSYGKPRQQEIVELTVGDDTKTGFNITLWMPPNMHVGWRDRDEAVDAGQPANNSGARSNLRRAVKEIRPRDVVMLQHVALSEYKGKVHGQSLKGDVTKLDLIFRKRVDDDDLQGCYTASNLRNPTDPQIKKCKAVRDWLVEFVGEPMAERGKGKKGRRGRLMLPEDSQ